MHFIAAVCFVFDCFDQINMSFISEGAWCIHICSACCTHCPFALACVRILVHTCITVFCLSFAMDKKSFLFVFGKISHKPYLVCLRLLTQQAYEICASSALNYVMNYIMLSARRNMHVSSDANFSNTTYQG